MRMCHVSHLFLSFLCLTITILFPIHTLFRPSPALPSHVFLKFDLPLVSIVCLSDTFFRVVPPSAQSQSQGVE